MTDKENAFSESESSPANEAVALKSTRHRDVRRVLILTLIGNVLVAVAKLVVGLISGSLAMIADGFHSMLDSASNVIGLIGNAIAARPPDSDHPYGHRRFETMASMAIGGMLLLSGWEIVKSSLSHLMEQTAPEITTINFVVIIATIGINVLVSTYETRAGRRLGSEFLLADATHTRSDILVSLTVLASLIAVRLGLGWFDALAALVVVVLIGLAAWQIVRDSAGILVDRAALDAAAVEQIAQQVAGVLKVERVRSRGPSDDIHLDLDIRIAASTTAQHSKAIANEIRAGLRDNFLGLTDIQVYFAPLQEGPLDHTLIARAEADALGLGVHSVVATTIAHGVLLDMHVEVEPEQSVREAHAIVSSFEERLSQAIPDLEKVVTHIEPAQIDADIHAVNDGAHGLAREVMHHAKELYPECDWHDFDIRIEPDGGYAVSMHCFVAKTISIEDAHTIAETVEAAIRAVLPAIHRVTIHTEPRGETD